MHKIKVPVLINLKYGHTAPQVKRVRPLKITQSSSNPLRVRGGMCIAPTSMSNLCGELSVKDAPHGWFCEKHSQLESEMFMRPKGGGVH